MRENTQLASHVRRLLTIRKTATVESFIIEDNESIQIQSSQKILPVRAGYYMLSHISSFG